MSTTTDVYLGRSAVGNTDRIQFTINKDGIVWAAVTSVSLTFVSPDGLQRFTRDMVLLQNNVWYYDTTVSDLNQAGTWTLSVNIVQGAVVKKYPYEITLEVAA